MTIYLSIKVLKIKYLIVLLNILDTILLSKIFGNQFNFLLNCGSLNIYLEIE